MNTKSYIIAIIFATVISVGSLTEEEENKIIQSTEILSKFLDGTTISNINQAHEAFMHLVDKLPGLMNDMVAQTKHRFGVLMELSFRRIWNSGSNKFSKNEKVRWEEAKLHLDINGPLFGVYGPFTNLRG